ncbi:YhgE/Pip domain-containing protein [Mycobacterium kyorinense]|uniref:YhgE/Pip domain-containing protein n=1 Tax=Mycobacterium kyorinense TaxID=487514 RepID=UPI0009ECDAA6
MPQPQHHAATVKATRTVRFWAVPIVVTLAVLSALAALYLGGILKPTTSLRHFPVAVVNEDAGPTGAQIVKGLVAGLDKDKFEVRVLTREAALHELDTAKLYGAVGIPPDFSSKLQTFAKDVAAPGRIDRPMIVVSTNPRAGTLASSIAGQTLSRAATAVNRKVGERLSEEVALQTNAAPMAAGVTAMLADPIHIQSEVYKPLPNGTGNGLSAFYYALLLLLAGFTGSIVVSTLVDSMLGYVPAEFGPVYRFAEQVNISRFRTLLVKWALMLVLALLTSAVYMVIANGLGMPIPDGRALWLYGVFAIVAVGVTSTSLIAVLGSVGLLVSMLLFVILGLPSAGATVPLEAAPSFFGWLAKFEPMHQVFLGVRALLYLDGHADAGLTHALILTAVGLVIGLLLGGIVTRIYDRRGYHRIPAPASATATDEIASTSQETTPPSE